MNLNLLQDAFKHIIPEQFCAKKSLIPARAHFRKYLILNFFGIIQNKSSMRYIELQVNWDEEFISVVKTDAISFALMTDWTNVHLH